MPPLAQRSGFLVLAVLASSCAAQQIRSPGVAAPTTEAPEPRIAWQDLARHLPRGADTCTVANPQAVTRERRRQFAQVSWLPARLWAAELQIAAMVSVERRRRGGRGGRVIVLRSRLSGEALRAAVDAGAGFELRWTEVVGECLPDSCPSHARLADPHTVVITAGEWLAPADAVGVELDCIVLAGRHRRAFEWSATRGQSLRLAAGPMMPMRTAIVVRSGSRGAVWARRDRMVTPELAAEAAATGVGPGDAAVGGRELVRTHDGADVVTTTEILWDDLQLRLDDRARLAAAKEEAEQLLRLRPGDDVDVARPDRVHAQLAYRLSLMESASAVERASVRQGVVSLLRRAVAEHPAEVAFAQMLVEMLITDQASAAEAARLAAVFVDDPKQGEEFQRLRKHALALSDERALADVLVAERVVRSAVALGAARDIAGLLRAGHPYAAAQSAWSLSAGIARRAHRVALEPVKPVTLPLGALLDGLLALRHLGAASGQLHVLLLHGDGFEGVAESRRLLVMHDRALLRLDPADGSGARIIGAALGSAGLSGPLELTISARERGGRVLRLRGEVKGGEFILRAADARSASVNWQLLSELMFAPLASLGAGEFWLPASGVREARRMVRLASGAFGVACEPSAGGVRCRASGSIGQRARGALLALVAPRLSKDALRLWDP